MFMTLFAPSGNCGMAQIQGCASLYPSFSSEPSLTPWLLKMYEKWLRIHSRGFIVGNDVIKGTAWHTWKKYGEGWNFIDATWNRNYDTSPHRIGMFWKATGEYAYEPFFDGYVTLLAADKKTGYPLNPLGIKIENQIINRI